MTDETLPAIQDQELARFARLGQWLAFSESGNNTPTAVAASAALRLYYARELGLPPMAASELSVIKGRLFVQAKLLRALAAQHGYRVKRTDSSDETCTAVLERDGVEVGRTTFTISDAKRAGLIRDRSAWQTHPARMLWARASKYVLDDYAPEVTLGLATDDELVEIQDGAVIDAEPVEEPEPQPTSETKASEWHHEQILRLLDDLNIKADTLARIDYLAEIVGHPFNRISELTAIEAQQLISELKQRLHAIREQEQRLLEEAEGELAAEEIPFGEH